MHQNGNSAVLVFVIYIYRYVIAIVGLYQITFVEKPHIQNTQKTHGCKTIAFYYFAYNCICN